jgi:hypothetical protein
MDVPDEQSGIRLTCLERPPWAWVEDRCCPTPWWVGLIQRRWYHVRRFSAVAAVAAVILAMPLISLAGVPCSGTSSMWPDSCVFFTGDTMYIYASVMDCYGSPLEGWPVNFYTDRGADDVIIGNGPLTDPTGLAEARLSCYP